MKTSAVLTIAAAFSFLVDVVSSQGQSLVNRNGKCLDISIVSNQLIQSTCSRIFTTWYYDNLTAKDRHICRTYLENCVASPMNSGGNTNLIKWGWKNEAGQRFTFKEDKATGYFRIVNDHGKCLSVGQNSKDEDAWVYAWDCNEYEDGQLWKWF